MRFNYPVVIATISLVVLPALVVVPGSVIAQEVDNTETLPNAKAGECYAKVVTPAEFTTQTETVVVQEASERIQTLPAKYETVQQTIVVKEESTKIQPVAAVYEDGVEKVEVAAASVSWFKSTSGKPMPASPSALEAITGSGVDLASVKPGSCFREYFTPPEFKTESQQVLVSEGSENISVIPAEYEEVDERVVVKEASSQVVDVPATYRSETQQVLVEPAKTVWKEGRGPVERIDNSTGEIMCLVEVPARYETVTKTVLDRPASSKRIEVPAVYKAVKVRRLVKPAAEKRTPVAPQFKTITTRVKVADPNFYWLAKGEKAAGNAEYSGNEVCLVESKAKYASVKTRVLKSPASTKVVAVPAEYETIRVNRLISPATENRIPIPEKTKTITKRVQTSPSRLEWRKVLCETNITPKIVSDLQRALKREGFDPGKIDGVLGASTSAALESFQLDRNLDRGGLTYESIKALEVEG